MIKPFAMGMIRKTLSGTAAVVTGGLSLAVFQFRSDTERNSLQVKKMRREFEKSAGRSVSCRIDANRDATVLNQNAVAQPPTGSMISETISSMVEEIPEDRTPGWKSHPEKTGRERFWNGSSWTSLIR